MKTFDDLKAAGMTACVCAGTEHYHTCALLAHTNDVQLTEPWCAHRDVQIREAVGGAIRVPVRIVKDVRTDFLRSGAGAQGLAREPGAGQAAISGLPYSRLRDEADKGGRPAHIRLPLALCRPPRLTPQPRYPLSARGTELL